MQEKIVISTAYLPPIDYMMAMYRSGEIFIELHETYARQTWRNRCSIATANGRLDLSIPVEKPLGNSTPTAQVIISTKHSWQKNHWRAIQSAYCKSPYFIYYSDLLESFYMAPHPEKLITWNNLLLNAVASQILPLPPIKFTSEYEKHPEGLMDLREAFSPKSHRQAIDVSRELPQYYQVFSDKNSFIPNLSILDLLFNMGPEAASFLKQKKQV